MRRLAALTLAVFAACAVAALVVPGPRVAQGDNDYRVDAIFDSSKGIIPGQLVKVAGAKVGKVTSVTLTKDYKARIGLSVDSRFAPFRSDAHCAIKPEGLIAENFVECDPGTPGGKALKGHDDIAPTVPVDHTAVPVNLTDLFDIWRMPVRERLSVLLSSLGAGFMGRGGDLNAIIHRANPTLTQARRVLTILDGQRFQLAGIVRDTDTLVAQLAARRDRVTDFIGQAARVVRVTALHRGELSDAVRRLPPLLRETRPALAALDTIATDGTPLVRKLQAAAPSLASLLRDAVPFSQATTPTLRRLKPAAITGIATAKAARPVVSLLRTFSAAAIPTGRQLATLVTSLRDRGALEGILRFIYLTTAATARYDATSHVFPAHVLVNSCVNYATTVVPACSARYDTGGVRAATRIAKPREAGTGTATGGSRAGSHPQSVPHAGSGGVPAASGSAAGSSPAGAVPGLPSVAVPKLPKVPDPAGALLGYLLGK